MNENDLVNTVKYNLQNKKVIIKQKLDDDYVVCLEETRQLRVYPLNFLFDNKIIENNLFENLEEVFNLFLMVFKIIKNKKMTDNQRNDFINFVFLLLKDINFHNINDIHRQILKIKNYEFN